MGRNKRQISRVACIVGLISIISSSAILAVPQRPAKRMIVCKTPENATSCYWAHGRLSIYNGTPTYRLWKIGTHRILGIYSGPNGESTDALDAEHPKLPPNLDRAFKSLSTEVFGDFEICPLEQEEAGVMQAACIESAKNIFAAETK
jgi:hypothetical protein